jgi:hypothetical protein
MADDGELPFILKGKYFEIVERNGKQVTAKCKNCTRTGERNAELKGAINSTTNFLTHLKVWAVNYELHA